MKVLDLSCGAGHVFEGWFASEQAFQDQLAGGLLECPVCGGREVHKCLTAPRLNLGRHERSSASVPASEEAATALPAQAPDALQARLQVALREWVGRAEDVGTRFAEEARRIHHGEATARDIRGQASMEEARALLDEGVAVMPLPDLPWLKGPLH